ncbi:MAG: hydroxymethylbilane synthase [Chthoniobacteraceae bacterium]
MSALILGTRGSALALAQAELTEAALVGVKVERRIFTTRGDVKLDLSLLQRGEAGAKGLFTKELEDALLAGAIDVAVHSLKDLPGHQPDGLQLTAVLERAPTADTLVTREPLVLATLPHGARVGTSSVRRARQVRWLRPDLTVEDWRGNVPSRLRKFRERYEMAAIILAEAGLRRLGYAFADGRMASAEGEFFATSLADDLLPAIGQGAVALQSRVGDERVSALLAAINHAPTWTSIRAERELQRLLAGDCSLPIGVRCVLDGDRLAMSAILFGAGNLPPLRAEANGPASEPERIAAEVFRQLSR